ncbi:hypothetical protein HELRODRAFT_165611 [Helobdella robusta]|uniref:Laminin EGF-like domain-containing protein n=1 Tax=Helobdella robusta TaxID=6412 RepID=T1EX28_HELRO|nr:hypothetical protein HELRODRAFT_165611 [Helobdella robusta]ESN91559.1 hypothetical protein HELRODRAFT_165611 [Helobdella robusta]
MATDYNNTQQQQQQQHPNNYTINITTKTTHWLEEEQRKWIPQTKTVTANHWVPTHHRLTSLHSPHHFITISLLLFFISPHLSIVVEAFENVCQAQTGPGPNDFTYSVCQGDPLKILRSNASYSNTSPRRCFTCTANQFPISYMTDVIPNTDGQPNYNTSWQSLTWLTFGRRPQASILISAGRRFVLQDDLKFTFASQRPKQAILEKSVDYGVTWQTLQIYNISCASVYNAAIKQSIVAPDDVMCSEEYSSEWPSTGGEVKFEVNRDRLQMYLGSMFNNFEALYNAYQDTNLLEFLTFTDLKLNLIYPGTDGGEFSGRQNDLLGYSYAISNIYLVAGCDCNRHAKFCVPQNGRMVCVCEHNTAGENCEKCLPLYNNRLWALGSFKPPLNGTANECQKCECHGRAVECLYDPGKGRGVCINCANNTMGDNCAECMNGYFINSSISIDDPGVCNKCDCEPHGMESSTEMNCSYGTGQCQCKKGVTGLRCDSCYSGTYGLLSNDATIGTCKQCSCNVQWTINGRNDCDQLTGQCPCVTGVGTRDCSICSDGYFKNATNNNKCDPCQCNYGGAVNQTCNKLTSDCTCRPNIISGSCRVAKPDFYVPAPDYINLKPTPGSTSTCTNTTSVDKPIDEPFTERWYFSCFFGQKVNFVDVLSRVRRQGNIIQSYVPSVRYAIRDVYSIPGATLTITNTGPNINFDPTLYPPSNGSASDCIQGSTQVFTIFNLPPGFGQAWWNDTAKALLNARCKYDAEFKVTDAVNFSSPLLFDSLVLVPDPDASLVYTSNVEKQEIYDQCIFGLIQMYSNVRNRCLEYYFTLMAEQTAEAYACNCDSVGTVPGSVCSYVSGQCQCKLNVGGRRCEYCLRGTFAFSDTGCQNCSCDMNGSFHSVCDYTSGQCPCRPNVATYGQITTMGAPSERYCRFCLANFFGLPSGQGCQPCNCHSNGSASQQCDVITGACPCKDTFGGQKCDQCRNGFYGFNATAGCTCDLSGNCYCKPNVGGAKCNQCKPGMYNLDATNADGCQPCYCSSSASSPPPVCTSAVGFKMTTIQNDTGWEVQNPFFLFHLSSPPPYLGYRVSSYNQFIQFTMLSNTTFNSGKVQLVILVAGDGRRISYQPDNVAFLQNQPNLLRVQLNEKFWVDSARTLSSLSQLLIQTYFLERYQVTLSQVIMTSSAPIDWPYIAINYVEQCTCSNNMEGLSCERCKKGFKRAVVNDTTSACIDCQCEGMTADTQVCDEMVGRCLNCPAGRVGDRCDKCAPNVDESLVGAEKCSKCKKGYWGISSAGCVPCQCNAVGSQDTTTCNMTSGQCTCQPNVAGVSCDRCSDGYTNFTVAGCSMSSDQTSQINGISNATLFAFANRLVKAEADSKYLKTIVADLNTSLPSYSDYIEELDVIYQIFDASLDTVLRVLSDAIAKLLDSIKTNQAHARTFANEASLKLLQLSKSFPAYLLKTSQLSNLSDSLNQMNQQFSGVSSPISNSFAVLNNSVITLESNSNILNSNVINLSTNLTQQIMTKNTSLVNDLNNTIEKEIASLNVSSASLKLGTAGIKLTAFNQLTFNSTVIYNMIRNVNFTGDDVINVLALDDRFTALQNNALDLDTRVKTASNQTAPLENEIQNYTQLTTDLLTRANVYLSQAATVNGRVTTASAKADQALNQSITVTNNAANMADVMKNFNDKANALIAQSSGIIQTANNNINMITSASTTALAIITAVDPLLQQCTAAYGIANSTYDRCMSFNATLTPVMTKSRNLTDSVNQNLNDVSFKMYQASRNALNSYSNDIDGYSTKASDLDNAAAKVRSLANAVGNNITDTTKVLSNLNTRLDGINPPAIDMVTALLNDCRATKVTFDSYSLPAAVQKLQNDFLLNKQWLDDLTKKRDDLLLQKNRMKVVMSQLS